jgi:diguanylate cyclase (GGDEF)-like protein
MLQEGVMNQQARPRIICVDDQQEMLDSLVRVLRNSFDVSTATNGQNAIHMLREQGPFAVLVADLKMPGMNGIELLTASKEIAPDTVRVLLSGEATVQTAADAVNQSNIFRFLIKPYPRELLVLALDDAIAQHHRGIGNRSTPKPWDAIDTQLEQALRLAPDPFLVLDKDGVTQFHNPAAASFFDVESSVLHNHRLGIPLIEESGEQLISSVSGRSAQMQVTEIEWKNKPCWLLILRDVTEQLKMTEELALERQKLESANKQLYETSISDPLTGLLNRRGLEVRLWDEIARSRRYGGNLSAVLIDCDEFKAINTKHGHAVGDLALSHIAAIIEKSTRATDVVSRIGGDEFLVLLPETRQAEGVIVAEKVRKIVAESQVSTPAGFISVSISAGVALILPTASTVEAILLQLKEALEVCKSTGRDRVVSSEQVQREILSVDTLMEDDFFNVFTQPIVDLTNGSVMGHECFCRGKAERGQDPRRLFQLARDAGRLTELDVHCISTTIKHIAEKRPRHFHCNLFPTTLTEEQGPELAALFSGAANASFCIELSEQDFAGDASAIRIRESFSALRHKGVYLALKDIGFGGKTLEAIICLEPDFIRVSRGFLGGVEEVHVRRRSWSRLIQVARAIGAKVIAEGIEEKDEAELIADLGVQYGQGYFFGKPVLAG